MDPFTSSHASELGPRPRTKKESFSLGFSYFSHWSFSELGDMSLSDMFLLLNNIPLRQVNPLLKCLSSIWKKHAWKNGMV